MGDAEKIEAERRRNLESAINSSNLNQRHIPVFVEEIKVPPSVEELEKQVSDLDTRIGMVENDLSGLTAALIGYNGEGGAINDLKDGQRETKEAVNRLSDTMSSTIQRFMEETRGTSERITKNKTDIDGVGRKAQRAMEAIEKHTDEHHSDGRRRDERRKDRLWQIASQVLVVVIIGILALAVPAYIRNTVSQPSAIERAE